MMLGHWPIGTAPLGDAPDNPAVAPGGGGGSGKGRGSNRRKVRKKIARVAPVPPPRKVEAVLEPLKLVDIEATRADLQRIQQEHDDDAAIMLLFNS